MKVASMVQRTVVLSVVALSVLAQGAVAKDMTVYERQVALTKKVEKMQKANELTLKEADRLRDKLAKVNEKKDKYLADNGGKLAAKDETKLEKMLNDISVDINKKSLEKRVE